MPRGKGNGRQSSPPPAGQYTRSSGFGSPVASNPLQRLSGWDGSTVATYPFFDPLLTKRSDVLIFEFSQFTWGPFQNGAGGQSWPVNILQNVTDQIYQFLLNSLSAQDRNLALLTLATASHIEVYVNNWCGAYAGLRGLQAIVNSQGFNQTLNKIGPVVAAFRGRIQSDLNQLFKIPIPPGMPKLLDELFGVFAASEDSVAIISMGNVQAITNVPADYTLPATITTILTDIETNLAFFTGTGFENQNIQTLLANAYGAGVNVWPSYGVRINPAKVNRILTMGVQNIAGVTNTFTLPANFNGGVQVPQIPILTLDNYDDPLMLTLYRHQPLWAGSNGPKANSAVAGLFSHLPTNSTNFAYYDQQAVYATAGVSGAFNGYAQAGMALWWGPQVANSETNPYGTDQRGYQDFNIFYVPLDYIVEQTIDLTYKIWLEKFDPTTVLPKDVSQVGQTYLVSPPYTRS